MLKRFSRSAFGQAVIGLLVSAYMRLVVGTTRWRVEGEEALRGLWSGEAGFLLATWHSNIVTMPVIWTRYVEKLPARPALPRMMISASRDGGLVSNAMDRMGIPTIRGSAANPKKPDKAKGGLAALRETTKALKAGSFVCVTPDGPRGPRQRVGDGVVRLAQLSGAPILLFVTATSGARRLDTWDRFKLPGLFGRGVLLFDGPVSAPRDADAETVRRDLEDRLNALAARAEAEVGLSPVAPADPETAAA